MIVYESVRISCNAQLLRTHKIDIMMFFNVFHIIYGFFLLIFAGFIQESGGFIGNTIITHKSFSFNIHMRLFIVFFFFFVDGVVVEREILK